jgi:hypothetical protein
MHGMVVSVVDGSKPVVVVTSPPVVMLPPFPEPKQLLWIGLGNVVEESIDDC